MRSGVLALVAISLLAGCGTFAGPDAASTVTPAPVATPGPEEAPGPADLAPGVTRAGIVDENELFRAHIGLAENTSLKWTVQYRESGLARNGSYGIVRTRTVAYESEDSGYRFWSESRRVITGDRQYVDRREQYGTQRGGYRLSLNPESGERSYGRIDRSLSRADFALPNRPLHHYIDLDNESVSAVDVGGRPHYQITGTRDAIPTQGRVEGFSSRVIVREDGLIREIGVSFVTTYGVDAVPIRYDFVMLDVGDTTITEPAWLPEARARVDDGT